MPQLYPLHVPSIYPIRLPNQVCPLYIPSPLSILSIQLYPLSYPQSTPVAQRRADPGRTGGLDWSNTNIFAQREDSQPELLFGDDDISASAVVVVQPPRILPSAGVERSAHSAHSIAKSVGGSRPMCFGQQTRTGPPAGLSVSSRSPLPISHHHVAFVGVAVGPPPASPGPSFTRSQSRLKLAVGAVPSSNGQKLLPSVTASVHTINSGVTCCSRPSSSALTMDHSNTTESPPSLLPALPSPQRLFSSSLSGPHQQFSSSSSLLGTHLASLLFDEAEMFHTLE